MSEKEKKICETICNAVHNMSDFDKGYFLGTAETMARTSEMNNKGKKDEPDKNIH